MQMGQQVHTYENLLNREFHADRPNSKRVTDISYIHTKQGVLYLPMIRGLYDNGIVAYKTGTQQTVNLALDMIRLAMKKAKKKISAELQLHSDQGFQYTSQAYFNLTQEYGITPSPSRGGTAMTTPWQRTFFHPQAETSGFCQASVYLAGLRNKNLLLIDNDPYRSC